MPGHGITLFKQARALYLDRQFTRAREVITAYQRTIAYESFPRKDNRGARSISVSVIIVSFAAGKGLLECLASLAEQTDQDFEIIVVDNGGNEAIHSNLLNRQVLHIITPLNFFPSEARNIGAYFAKGEVFVFLDDDALVHREYVSNVKRAIGEFNFLALRGKVLPKAEGRPTNEYPWQYDLGHYPVPAVLLTEGNMAICRSVFDRVGGFDPVLFGREGTELTHRCLAEFPGRDIYYWPGMVIYHDFAEGDRLHAKKERQGLAIEYLRQIHPGVDLLSQAYRNWYRSCPGGSFKETHASGERAYSLSYRESLQRERAERFREQRDKLRVELESVRDSATFKTAAAIREAVEQPVAKGPGLPIRLIRLLREQRSNKG